MNVLVLGRGKTGALVASVVLESGHDVTSVGRDDILRTLTAEELAPFDVVIDFTSPEAVLTHIEACARAAKSMVVGTTGWYGELPRVRKVVEDAKTTLVWGGNFSVGVNVFYRIVRAAAVAAKYGYEFRITETHHVHKKDAPSGTAVVLRNLIEESAGGVAEIDSVREGENMGRHEITLSSDVDTITLTHQAHSRRGFALGAVRAAEWVVNHPHTGLHEFTEIFTELS